MAIYAPDQRGFGATADRGGWAGVPRMVADAVAMGRMVRARHPGARFVLMGESMGGALAMVAATAPEPAGADAYVLLAPAVWGREQMGIVLSSGLWIVSSVAPGWEVTGAEVPIKIRASDNREALIRLAEDPLTIRRTKFSTLRGLTDCMDAAQEAAPRFAARGLFLSGGKDQLVPPHATAAMWRRLPETHGNGPRRALLPERLPPSAARPRPPGADPRHPRLARRARRPAALGRRFRRRQLPRDQRGLIAALPPPPVSRYGGCGDP